MSVHDAEPMDIYVDEHGELWRVVGTFSEPTVIMERVEKSARSDMEYDSGRKLGGVSGSMWMGWKRIYRPAKKPPLDLPRRPVPLKDSDCAMNT
jgi:hypothetical protein